MPSGDTSSTITWGSEVTRADTAENYSRQNTTLKVLNFFLNIRDFENWGITP